jgi:signal transduction histidine kinase
LKSASLRFALLCAALIGSGALAVAGFVWLEMIWLIDRNADDAIIQDQIALTTAYQRAPPGLWLDSLSEEIEVLLDKNSTDAVYLLANSDWVVKKGTLARWPTPLKGQLGWNTVHIEWFDQGDVPTMLRVKVVRLDPSGYYLLIGRTLQLQGQLIGILPEALIWALAVVIAMATAGGLVVARLFRNAIMNVSATALAVSHGDLTKRVPLSGRGDEFDRLADLINGMLDRISRLMDGVRNVSNAIAHDLRTPIARARARLEDAIAAGRSNEDLHAAVERAVSDLDEISSIFQALLRIAEIESGSRRSAFAAIDLAPVLADLADLYRAVAEEKGVALRLATSDRLPALGDRTLIQQAIANLLDNATKFSPAGGTVALSGRIEHGDVIVTVADTGPGLLEGERARATERFFRGETARHTPGSGLGLALVQAVVQLHGGRLQLEDNRPGLRAIIILPAGGASDAV